MSAAPQLVEEAPVRTGASLFQRAIEAFEANDALYCLEVSDGHYVLFRIDGVIFEISEAVFELLERRRGRTAGSRLDALRDSIGEERTDRAAAAIVRLYEQDLLTGDAPPLHDPDVAGAEAGGLVLMVTQTCNLACAYCYGGGGAYGSKPTTMDLAAAKRAVDLMLARAPRRKEFTVTMFGGEPLLNFPLVRDVVEYCQRIGAERNLRFSYSMTTNGTKFTDAIVAFLEQHRFNLMVSYDGPGQKNRPFIGGRDSAPVVRAWLRKLSEAGLRFQMRATVTREMVTREAFDELSRFAAEVGRPIVTTPATPARNLDLQVTDELSVRDCDAPELARIYRETSDSNLQSSQSTAGLFDVTRVLMTAMMSGRARGLGRCGACMTMSSASTDGRIYPCHRFVGMKPYAIGTLKRISARRVRRFFARFHEATDASCRSCFARQICGGFCYYHQADGRGGFEAPDSAACDRYRDHLRYAIGAILQCSSIPV